MANERYDDKYEGHEEGEYHFSDDQVNYDLDAETPSKEGAAVVALPKESMAEKLKNHRRIVIGIVVFIVLLGIVYKLIMPSNTAPATDFSQQTTAQATKTTPKPTAPAMTQPQQPAAPSVTQQAAPSAMTTTTTTQVTQQVQPTTTAQQPISAPPAQPIATAQPAVPMTEGAESAVTTKGALDRIATLEQQNSAIMNLLQTQYTQRLADAEAQNTQLRAQVQDLTNRLTSMEVAFRQLTKILRVRSPGVTGDTANVMPGMSSSAPEPIRVVRPRSTYTVQAIIPGRAWLKSEAGDTVTVAEGDMLRGFGRITKIDPYDGIVDIDTGTKVITLSYGTSGD